MLTACFEVNQATAPDLHWQYSAKQPMQAMQAIESSQEMPLQ